jgi:hypothetical protein
MANEEGVKIIITAEDRFSETMKKIDASSKIFGETTKNTQRNLEALEKEMVRLVANGLDPADKKIKEMKANYDKLSQSLKGGDASLKKSNQQWTNLALVIQDLPYGFRGIQNNLPALIGGFAGVSGAAYVLGSALIAIWTAYGDKITEVIFKTNALDTANKQLKDGMLESVKSTSSAREELFKVSAVIKAGKDNLIDKTAALDYYNKQLGTTFGVAKTLEEAEAKIVEKTPKYIEAIGLKAKAQYYYAKAAEYAIKGDIAGLQDQTNIFDKLIAFSKGFADVATIGPKEIVKSILGSLSTAQNDAVTKITNNSKLIGDILFKSGNDAMDQYFKAFKEAGLSDKEIADIFKKFNDARNRAFAKSNALNQDDSLLNSLKAEQSLYKDDMFMKRAIGLEILKEEERLAIEKATFEKASNETLLNIANEFKFRRLTIEKETIDEIQKIRNADVDKAAKDKEKADKDAENAANKINDRNLQNALSALKIESDVATKIANASGKTTSADRIKILEDYKSKLYELASVGGYTAEQFDKIDDAINNVNGAIAGSKDKVKSFSVTWTDTINGINSTINDFINNSLYALGESIGKVLAGENVDAIDVFGTLIADALQSLGKQLIAFGVAKLAAWEALKDPTPAGAALAIAAGIAAVAAGAALKSTLTNAKSTEGGFSRGKNSNMPRKFADGGIISGPTYGLMGEYPGAKSNPEVVAPLDKLKDMIGGGGAGTFMLRGQDLLLSVNRAQKASNLKGQNISLA